MEQSQSTDTSMKSFKYPRAGDEVNIKRRKSTVTIIQFSTVDWTFKGKFKGSNIVKTFKRSDIILVN